MGTYPWVTVAGLTHLATASAAASKAVVINTTEWPAVRSRLSAASVGLSALGSEAFRRDHSCSPCRAAGSPSSFWGRMRTAGEACLPSFAARLVEVGLAIQPVFQPAFLELVAQLPLQAHDAPCSQLLCQQLLVRYAALESQQG